MKRISLVIIGLSLILATACISPNTESSTENTPAMPVMVFYFNGNSPKTSNTFHITKKDWYIEWQCELIDKEPPYDFMAVTFGVYPADKRSDDVLSCVGGGAISSPGSDRTYIHNHRGDFYIQVSSFNANWEIRVYE